MLAAELLDAVGIAIEHLQDGQRPLGRRQIERHVPGGGQGHERMEADVVLSAERAGIGQRGGRHELAGLDAVLHLLDQDRQQLVGRGVLHQADQRLQFAEGEKAFAIVGHGSA